MHFLSHSKTLVLSALFSIVSFSSTFSMELIAANSVSSREPVQLFSNRRNLFVQDKNAAYRVEKHNMNPLLQEVMQHKAMDKFTENGKGYVRVKQLSDGTYALDANVCGLGGGYWTGMAAAWTIRAVGYGAYGYSVAQTGGETLLHAAEAHECIEVGATVAMVARFAIPWLP